MNKNMLTRLRKLGNISFFVCKHSSEGWNVQTLQDYINIRQREENIFPQDIYDPEDISEENFFREEYERTLENDEFLVPARNADEALILAKATMWKDELEHIVEDAPDDEFEEFLSVPETWDYIWN